MEPRKEEIERTVVKERNGIKYTTHYINRPIRKGDSYGVSIGTMINGVSKTTECIFYKYKPTNT